MNHNANGRGTKESLCNVGHMQPEEVVKKMSELSMNGLVQPNSNGHMNNTINYGRDDIFANPVLDEELKHLNVDDVILKYRQGVNG